MLQWALHQYPWFLQVGSEAGILQYTYLQIRSYTLMFFKDEGLVVYSHVMCPRFGKMTRKASHISPQNNVGLFWTWATSRSPRRRRWRQSSLSRVVLHFLAIFRFSTWRWKIFCAHCPDRDQPIYSNGFQWKEMHIDTPTGFRRLFEPFRPRKYFQSKPFKPSYQVDLKGEEDRCNLFVSFDCAQVLFTTLIWNFGWLNMEASR